MKARIIPPERKPDTRTPEERAKKAMSLLEFAAVVGGVLDYSGMRQKELRNEHNPKI